MIWQFCQDSFTAGEHWGSSFPVLTPLCETTVYLSLTLLIHDDLFTLFDKLIMFIDQVTTVWNRTKLNTDNLQLYTV